MCGVISIFPGAKGNYLREGFKQQSKNTKMGTGGSLS